MFQSPLDWGNCRSYELGPIQTYGLQFQSPLDWGNCRSPGGNSREAHTRSCFSPLLIGAIVEANFAGNKARAISRVSVPS